MIIKMNILKRMLNDLSQLFKKNYLIESERLITAKLFSKNMFSKKMVLRLKNNLFKNEEIIYQSSNNFLLFVFLKNNFLRLAINFN